MGGGAGGWGNLRLWELVNVDYVPAYGGGTEIGRPGEVCMVDQISRPPGAALGSIMSGRQVGHWSKRKLAPIVWGRSLANTRQ